MARLASITGCKKKNLPFEYLGMPIGAAMSTSEGWSVLLEKFAKKLGSWKRNTLSMGGRLTLCKSVLGGIGVYMFSIFKAPMKVISRMEKLRKEFFLGSARRQPQN